MNWLSRSWRNFRGTSSAPHGAHAGALIEPDEIFLDSSNLPSLDPNQLEGRVERPVSRFGIIATGAVFLAVAGIFGYRSYDLQIVQGATYAAAATDNTLTESLVFSERGVIYDRNGTELAWNEPDAATSTPYADRRYTSLPGLSILLGYVSYPKQDSSGAWWRTALAGVSGTEKLFDASLSGVNGSKIIEKDALGNVSREHIEEPAQDGADLTLSIDADVQSKLFSILSERARANGFDGGAAVIMNVRTGQILAITSFPEYDNQAFADGDGAAIAASSNDPNSPLLDRAVGGLYAPGSIVKPMMAAAALREGIISPDKQIDSTGAISIPNPYDPSHPSLFRDWTAHGWIDMRTALAVSSDEYFYTIGGGYGGQAGLGINGIDEYAALFGFGTTTGIQVPGEKAGVVPSIAWKADAFPEDPTWRLGDTYHSSIGQYGWLVTPVEAVRYIAAIANGGELLTPQMIASSTPQEKSINIPDADLQIVREGMRLGITSTRSDAIEKFLDLSGIQLAGKTGTAQIGAHNEWMNSWAVGFWPVDNPEYAYAVVLERAPAGTLSGAAPAMLPFFQWLIANKPQYVN